MSLNPADPYQFRPRSNRSPRTTVPRARADHRAGNGAQATEPRSPRRMSRLAVLLLFLSLIPLVPLATASPASAWVQGQMTVDTPTIIDGATFVIRSQTLCPVHEGVMGTVEAYAEQDGHVISHTAPSQNLVNADGTWGVLLYSRAFDRANLFTSIEHEGILTITASCERVDLVAPYDDFEFIMYDPIEVQLTPSLAAPTAPKSVTSGSVFDISGVCPDGYGYDSVSLSVGAPGENNAPAPGTEITSRLVALNSHNTWRVSLNISDAIGHQYLTSTMCYNKADFAGGTTLYRIYSYLRTAIYIKPGPVTPTAPYVALGDSFSAGEGNAPYLDTSTAQHPNSCHRSSDAYPIQLARRSTSVIPAPKFVACSGAITQDLLSNSSSGSETYNPQTGQYVKVAPQLNAITPQTKLITLTIGGNDASFQKVLEACVKSALVNPKCRISSIAKQSSRQIAILGGSAKSTAEKKDGKYKNIHSYAEIIQRIHSAAPNARILIGGYPRFFDTSRRASWVYLPHTGTSYCTVGAVRLNESGTGVRAVVFYDDAVWLNSQSDKLNDAIAKGVTASRVKQAKMVDPRTAFNAHGACGKSSYFYRVTGNQVIGGKLTIDSSSMHPGRAGQLLYESAFDTP